MNRIKIARDILTSRAVKVSRELLDDPEIVYLTCGEVLPSEMYVTYHINSYLPALNVFYREVGSDQWESVIPSKKTFQNELKDIYHAKLVGLSGDTEYEFKIGEKTEKIYRFITMPNDLSRPVNIAFGSDFHYGYNTFKENLKIISENDCRMFIFAGDFVDDNGRVTNSHKWVEFWDNIAHKLVDTKGRLIPWVTIIGNHEFAPHNEMENLFFHDMFPYPKANPNYGVVDVSNYMSLMLLDFISAGGYVGQDNAAWKRVDFEAQRNWAINTINERLNTDFVIPVYHPAFYTSDRVPFRLQDREEYKKIFSDTDNIKVAFCGHDHVYKKTHKITWDDNTKQDRVAKSGERGFIEIGDGGMADKLYPGDRVGEWYIDTYAIHKPHVNIIKLESEKMTIEAKGTDGQVFDETVIGV